MEKADLGAHQNRWVLTLRLPLALIIMGLDQASVMEYIVVLHERSIIENQIKIER